MPGRGLTLRATATPISPGEAEPVNPQSAAAPCGWGRRCLRRLRLARGSARSAKAADARPRTRPRWMGWSRPTRTRYRIADGDMPSARSCRAVTIPCCRPARAATRTSGGAWRSRDYRLERQAPSQG